MNENFESKNLFLPLAQRPRPNGIFVRVTALDAGVEDFLAHCYERSREGGVYLEHALGNPDAVQTENFRREAGDSFSLEPAFFVKVLSLWLPRCKKEQISSLSEMLFSLLDARRKEGKTQSMLQNSYIKYMCWLRFRLEGVVLQLGQTLPPLILCGDLPGKTELPFLRALSEVGCDVVCVALRGDGEYLRADPESRCSVAYAPANGKPFPKDFSVKKLQRSSAMPSLRVQVGNTAPRPVPNLRLTPTVGLNSDARPRPVLTLTPNAPSQKPQAPQPVPSRPAQATAFRERAPRYAVSVSQSPTPLTNSWTSVVGLNSVERLPADRALDPEHYCNCFVRVEGVPNRATYPTDLVRLTQKIRESGRRLVVTENEIMPPTPLEISAISRQTYKDSETMILDLSANLLKNYSVLLQPLLVRAFSDCMREDLEQRGEPLNRSVTTAVSLLCWTRRYAKQLFEGYRKGDISCFIHYGACKNDREALFMRMLSRLPVDVLILAPDLSERCVLEDSSLAVSHYADSLKLKSFPKSADGLQVATDAYMAQRELDKLMYDNSGLYRDHQFSHTSTITLHSTYDEVSLFWDCELRYRPNFSTEANVASIPVIFAKINGVPRGDLNDYWLSIKKLMTPETITVFSLPLNRCSELCEPSRAFPTQDTLKDGRLCRETLKQQRDYPFGLLRNEMQEYIFDKMQTLIDKRLITGTFERGTEYEIVATIMRMSRSFVRTLQQFDFTKKCPKLLIVNTREQQASREDAIILAFLNLLGFDIACFVPTGYQCFEQWFTQPVGDQHNIGDYKYDLAIPDFSQIKPHLSLKNLFNLRL